MQTFTLTDEEYIEFLKLKKNKIVDVIANDLMDLAISGSNAQIFDYLVDNIVKFITAKNKFDAIEKELSELERK